MRPEATLRRVGRVLRELRPELVVGAPMERIPTDLALDAAFRPRAGVPRGDHVLYTGGTARPVDLELLLDAAARSRDAWPVCFIASGRAERVIAARAHRLRIAHRVSVRPPLRTAAGLARLYQRAACVVAPIGGRAALEAAASGARVVVPTGAAAVDATRELCETFEPGDPSSLAAAITRARRAGRDHAAAARVLWAHARAQAVL